MRPVQRTRKSMTPTPMMTMTTRSSGSNHPWWISRPEESATRSRASPVRRDYLALPTAGVRHHHLHPPVGGDAPIVEGDQQTFFLEPSFVGDGDRARADDERALVVD